MSKVYREMGGGPVPGHSGTVAQLRVAVAPPAVVGKAAPLLRSAASHGSVGAYGGAAPAAPPA